MSHPLATKRAYRVVGPLAVFLLALTLRASERETANPVVVSATGVGNPHVSFHDGYRLDTEAGGLIGARLAASLENGLARPTALTTADVDGDGVADLVTGYDTPNGGILGVQRGNIDALYPYSASVRAKREAGTLVEAPFFPKARLIETPAAPDFLGAGDFDADGRIDLVTASTREKSLQWLRGRGDGSFDEARSVPLPGTPSAMIAADVDRSDGLTDLIVGVAGGDPQLLVFEGPEGALRHSPERVPLPAEASAITAGHLDDRPGVDLAVAAENHLVIVHGRDRKLSTIEAWRSAVAPASIEVRTFQTRIRTIAAGRFTGGKETDIALVTEDGIVGVLDGGSGQLLQLAGKVSPSDRRNPSIALTAKVSDLQGQELIVLDRVANTLNIFDAQHFTEARLPQDRFPESSVPDLGGAEPITFRIAAKTVGVLATRLNGDALGDLLVLTDNRSRQRGSLHEVAFVTSAPMAEFVVDTDASGNLAGDNHPGDGACVAFGGGCTFDAAVTEANALEGPDLITFAISEISSQGWTEPVRSTITIDGSGQGHMLGSGQSQLSIFPDAVGVTVRGLAMNGTIQLSGGETEGGAHLIEDNYVGLNRDGTAAINPGGLSWRIDVNCQGNMIGGSTTNARNVVQGMMITQGDNVFQGNYIGLLADGSDLVEKAGTLSMRGENILFGGPGNGEGNVVAARSTLVDETTSLLMEGNLFGTDADGNEMLDPDEAFGDVEVRSSIEPTFGGTAPGMGNVVNGIGRERLRLILVENGVVQGNLIGLNREGTRSLGSLDTGIYLYLSPTSIVGGTAPGAGNVVSGNSGAGVYLDGNEPSQVIGNWIGTDAGGGLKVGNGGSGIYVDGAGWTVGGSGPGEGNVVGGNDMHGIYVRSSNNLVLGNFVGTDPSGTIDLGNTGAGVYLDLNARSNQIGGSTFGEGNTIAFNGEDGIFVSRNMREIATWHGNRISRNGGLGINLESFNDDEFGVTANDADDRDGSGPNDYQNFPELVKNVDGTLQISIDSKENTTYRVEFFGNAACDESGHGEGRFVLTTEDLATGADGTASVAMPLTTQQGRQFVTAVAIDPDGRSSEFSACAEANFEPALAVRVLADTLGRAGANPVPVPDTRMRIFRIDLSGPDNYLTAVGTDFTDENGLLLLDPVFFSPGDLFFLSSEVTQVPSPKSNRDELDNLAYRTVVDNLFIDRFGLLHPDTLAASLLDTTDTILGHPTVEFNLLVSIEWPASDDYVNHLADAFRHVGNFLYDVTNGQARFDKISVFDDKRRWEDADIQIYAANTEWPRTDYGGLYTAGQHMYLPPKHYAGAIEKNINRTYDDLDLNVTTLGHVVTLGHEFGHLAFGLYDEYQGKPPGATESVEVFPGTNFSVMDNQFRNDARASELSSRAYMTNLEQHDFQMTDQYQLVHGRTGWEEFDVRFSKPGGALPALIHTPTKVGVHYPDVVFGPNDGFGGLDLDVGQLIEFTLSGSGNDFPRQAFILTDADSGDPVPGVEVDLKKQTLNGIRWLKQGKTVLTGQNSGRIRPVGAVEGDRLLASGRSSNRFVFTEVDVPPAAGGKVQDDVVAQLKEVAGDVTMLASIGFVDGGLRFSALTGGELQGAPSLDVFRDDEPVETVAIDAGVDTYTTVIPDASIEEALLVLNAEDATGQSFPVPMRLSVLHPTEADSQVVVAESGAEIFLNPSSTGIERLSVLSSPFPAPEAGLPDSVVRVSPVYGIDVSPENLDFEMDFRIYYDPDSLLSGVPEGVSIYRWEDGWMAVETGVNSDSLVQTATARIDKRGYYAAYLDLHTATRTATEDDAVPAPNEFGLMQNYPNPFADVTFVPIVLDGPTRVRLNVYNVLGQKVGSLSDRLLQAGRHELRFDGSSLPSGTYLYVVEAGGTKRTGVMLIAR